MRLGLYLVSGVLAHEQLANATALGFTVGVAVYLPNHSVGARDCLSSGVVRHINLMAAAYLLGRGSALHLGALKRNKVLAVALESSQFCRNSPAMESPREPLLSCGPTGVLFMP